MSAADCSTCRNYQRKYNAERGDLGYARGRLAKNADLDSDRPARRDAAIREVSELSRRLNETRRFYAEHLRDAHGTKEVPAAFADLSWRRGEKGIGNAEAAELLRAGAATLEEIAEAEGIGLSAMRFRLNGAGWDVDGQPTVKAEPKPRRLLPLLGEDNAWMVDALCAQTDPEAFYPEKGGSTRDAKATCNGSPATRARPATPACPVKDQCLLYALDNDERFGIWGGLSERERRKLRKRDMKACVDCPTMIPAGKSTSPRCGPCRVAHRAATKTASDERRGRGRVA